MAESYQQVYPLAPANGHPRSDEESSNLDAKELKRKKRTKLAIYAFIFTASQIIVTLVFVLVVMRVKSPKLRLSDKFEFQTIETNSGSKPSFDISFTTQLRVKNTNWGPYKFDNTTAAFAYGGETVGQVVIPKGKAGMRSTKKVPVSVSLSSSQLKNNTNLGSELSGGILTLRCTAKMNGKVKLMLIMKKKKSANMNCTINIHVKEKTVNLKC